jgi:benzodiazapine receptor
MDRDSPSTAKLVLALAGWLALCYGAAALGSQFTDTGAWFQALRKPPWNPPNWLFGPVWTILYGLMGVAAWLVWKRRGFARGALPLGLFGVQLALNVAWSWLFFTARRPDLALFEIVVLWAAILATLLAFWRVRRAAGLLLVPYLAWVTFAAALNFAIWRLNA